MHKKFDSQAIEKKWQEKWANDGIYKTNIDTDKEKFYVLDMFPYPSGEGLHVGHPKGYIATDIYSRFKKMSGFEILHPMGWDAFGLPAENFAIKHKVHPRVAVEKNIANFKQQLAHLGFNYDWSKEINTTNPKFYKWTQWTFLKMLEKGLAFQSFEPINWCPGCQTGLANEDLESDGTCERCGSVVEKRPMRQWVLKITDYADRMLTDLDTLDWPEHIKEAQRNWIGKSEGALIDFELTGGEKVTVFTTRPDTLFGVTYLVLAPENNLLKQLPIKNQEQVSDYIKETRLKSEIERTNTEKEKTGVILEGVNAINPINGQSLPVFIADYVLVNYGTGAIMAVPAHDERDGEFATKFNLPAIEVVKDNVLINSGEFDGLDLPMARNAIVDKVGGKFTSTYKIRDWVFSRQRYWGEPIPVIHCDDCGVVPVPYDQLPVTLPEVDNYEPTGTGESPLANIDSWVNVPCPKCQKPAKRETNTMPQWAGSSWYYLRFIDPHNDEALIDKNKDEKWSPVDVYVGGDHAVRHLIYARFWHKFLYDIGVVSTIEPFKRLEFLGFILAEDGRKMSKRWGNVINPDDIVKQNGADAMRVYEMFMGPFENTVAWSTNGLVGAQRFVERSFGLVDHISDTESSEMTTLLHKTIKKVREDIEGFKFNTAISAMMIFVNTAEKEGLTRESYKTFLKLLAPFAPHITEELWSNLGELSSIHLESYPNFEEDLTVDQSMTIGVQINGKVRGSINTNLDTTEEIAIELAKENLAILKYLEGADILKVIYVPGKILNFIISQ